jgi:hypothetical protein
MTGRPGAPAGPGTPHASPTIIPTVAHTGTVAGAAA